MSPRPLVTAGFESMQSKSFYTAYHQAFRVLRADSDTLKDTAFRLRYEVYCDENHMAYGQATGHAALLEKDAYDDRAIHFLLYHKLTNEAAGTARLVLPRIDKPLHSFPMQTICADPWPHVEANASRAGELSRLCMTRAFRKRPGDGHALPGYSEQDMSDDGGLAHIRRVIPFAPLGLLRAAFEAALDHGLSDCLSVLEPSELYALQRIGLSYANLGPRLELGGTQQPIVINVKHALDSMILKNPPCWEIVTDQGRLHLKANAQSDSTESGPVFDPHVMSLIADRLQS